MTNNLIQRRRIRQRRALYKFPFGSLCGLITGAVAALIGVISGLDPLVISYRSLISALILGITVTLGVAVIQLANFERTNDNSQSAQDT